MESTSATMTDNLMLSLQASPKSDPDKHSLPFLISRINEQRGSFRNVNEESLKEEIRGLEAGQAERVEDSDDDEEANEDRSRREQLALAREEMLRQVTQAHNESAQALDFISLLLSQHAPHQAQQTLNPFIKNALPLGVLGTDTVQVSQKTEAQKYADSMVAIGWKMQSLDSAADSLLKSATRLEQEMERETTYWEKILAVKEQGWSVCRLPREKHTLGVKYGFSEAYADFRDRGLGALRRDQDGDVSLDRGPRSSDRVLRVQIVQKGNVFSSSCDPGFVPPKNEDGNMDDLEDKPIEQQILQARNAIFDEELHSELHREARNLVNQGVRCIGDTIQVPYEADKHLEIDLLDREKHLIGASQDNNNIADAIAIALHILLSHAHRQNLHRRSQPPPPITDGKRPRPVYTILKPIIENIRHRSDVHSLRDRLSDLTATLKQAGLPLAIDHTATTLNIPPSLSLTRKDEALVTDSLLNALTAPLRTSIKMHLPSRQTSLQIDVHTNLLPPTLGTEFRTTMTTSVSNFYMSNLPETLQFSRLTDVEEHITHLLTLDLVKLVTASDPAWEVVNPYIGSISRTANDRDGKLGSMSLRLSFGAYRALILEWQSRKEDEEEVKSGMARWEGDKGGRGLMDVVRELGESVAS